MVKKNILSALFLALTIVGCKKFVQIDPPNTQLTSNEVFNNNTTATSALLNIYEAMYNNSESYSMAWETGFMSDELKCYSKNATNLQYYKNSLSESSNTFGPWSRAYNYIYQTNAILEGVQGNKSISSSVQKQLIGEAKFIRAYWYFYLTNCYGDVPIVTGTAYANNLSLARSPQTQVYRQIISDLSDAQSMLNNDFVDASDTTITIDRVRPTKWAATAVLARAYLYTKKYDSAATQASLIINNNSMFSLTSDLDSTFLMNNTEAIWQLAIPLPNTKNTPDGANFILTGTPKTSAISSQLISAFEPGDLRRAHWVGTINTYYFPYKYKVRNDATISEYVMMLRLAEQYLIRAEAKALGPNSDLTGAVDDLNVVRNRAGLSTYAGSVDQASIVQAILHERQVELFTEWGHRWFDLVRTGEANAVMGDPGNVCQSKGGTWNSNWQLFPIPLSDRKNDPNLTQNQGY